MAVYFTKYGVDTWYINVIDSIALSTSQLALCGFLGVRVAHVLVIAQLAMRHKRQMRVLLEVAAVLK